MRHEPAQAEVLPWRVLRGRKLGTRFRRQHAIGRFIVDFVCFPERLVIEVDGESHHGTERIDANRDEALRSMGYHVICFRNDQVLPNAETVTEDIANRLRTIRIGSRPSSPSPDGEGAGG